MRKLESSDVGIVCDVDDVRDDKRSSLLYVDCTDPMFTYRRRYYTAMRLDIH